MQASLKLFACTLLLGPALALAQEEGVTEEPPAVEEAPAEEAPAGEEGEWAHRGHIDVFYVPSSVLTVKSGSTVTDEDGKAFGARGLYRFGSWIAASGEFETIDYKDADIGIDEARLSVGAMADNDSGGTAGLFLEYAQLKSDEIGDADGFGVHGQFSARPGESLHLYFDFGYLQLQGDAEDLTGTEFMLGALYRVGAFGVFADLRRSQLKGDDSEIRTSIADVRAGIRMTFGG